MLAAQLGSSLLTIAQTCTVLRPGIQASSVDGSTMESGRGMVNAAQSLKNLVTVARYHDGRIAGPGVVSF